MITLPFLAGRRRLLLQETCFQKWGTARYWWGNGGPTPSGSLSRFLLPKSWGWTELAGLLQKAGYRHLQRCYAQHSVWHCLSSILPALLGLTVVSVLSSCSHSALCASLPFLLDTLTALKSVLDISLHLMELADRHLFANCVWVLVLTASWTVDILSVCSSGDYHIVYTWWKVALKIRYFPRPVKGRLLNPYAFMEHGDQH